MKEAVDQDRHPSQAPQTLLEAELAWRLGRPEARTLARSVLDEAQPEQVLVRAKANWILAELAQATYEQTREPDFLEERIRRLKQVLLIVPSGWPETPHMILGLADALSALGRRDEAREQYEKLRGNEQFWPMAEMGLLRLGQPPAPTPDDGR
jgi:hypothetical protein